MNATERATKLLEGFIGDRDQRVMVLKGPWGVGKSYFVRRFLQDHKKENGLLPTFLSYASVFGLHSIQEVQSMINRCIEPTSPAEELQWLNKAHKAASKAGVKTGWFGIAELGDAAYWYLAKTKGLFAIIDDIERAPELEMDQLLGLASSLTESVNTKVLLVLNADKLSEESTNVFARYREKVVDAELLFNPTAQEIVEVYLHEKFLIETVVTCLEASGGANIRLIKRINRAVHQFREAADAHRIPYDDNDLRQITKLVWLFHVSPLLPDSQAVRASWGKRLFGKQDKEEIPPEEQELDRLRSAVSYRPNSFEDLVLTYLRTGYFSEEALIKQAKDETQTAEQMAFDRRIEQLFEPYHKNFRVSKEQMIADMESVLAEFPQRIGVRELRQFCQFLEDLGHDPTKWWRQYLPKIAATLDPRSRKEVFGFVTDLETRKELEQETTTNAAKFDPIATIREIAEKHSWNDEQMDALEVLPESFYHDWFQSEEGELLTTIREFLVTCTSSPPASSRGRLGQKILGVLRDMAKVNPTVRLQLRDVFDIKLPAASEEEKSASGSDAGKTQ